MLLPSSNRRAALNLSGLQTYLWIILLHGLLLYPLIGDFTASDKDGSARLMAAGLVVVFVLSHWLVMFRQSQWHSRVGRMVPFLLFILVLTSALVRLDSTYRFLFLFAAGYAFRYLPMRWAVTVGIITSGFVIADHLDNFWQAPSLANLFPAMSSSAGLVLAILVVAWIAQFSRQYRERQVLLEQLQAAQGELVSVERQAGIMEERARLAREIHDTLAQGLVSIVMHLEAAEQTLPSSVSATSQHLDQARRVARDNLVEARRFVWALQPEALERDALPNALVRVAEHWRDEQHIPVAVSITGDACTLTPELQVTLLRAAQEALANVSKHARAHQVNLTLSYMNDRVVLDVNDDGIGFDLTQMDTNRQADGFGLAGMRQRVERLDGRLSIESAKDEGTTVVVEIPILHGEKS